MSEQTNPLETETGPLDLIHESGDEIDSSTAPPVIPASQSASKPVKRSFFGSLFKRNKPVEVKLDQVPREDKSVLQLKKGYNEIVDTMSAMRTHMEQQSDRADRMLEIMEQLPKVLNSIPETTAAQTHVLQAIHQNIQTQNETQVQLSAALTNLASATQQQEDAVKGIRNELSLQRGEQAEVINSLSGTLGQVTAASVANTDAMRAVARKAEETERNTNELFDKSRRNTLAIAFISWSAAVLILVVSMFMFLELRKERSADATQQTPAVSANDTSLASSPVVQADDAGVVEPADEATPDTVEAGIETPAGAEAQAGIGVLLDGLLETEALETSTENPDPAVKEPAALDTSAETADTAETSESSVESEPADDASEAIDEVEGAEEPGELSLPATGSEETADAAEASAETVDAVQDKEPLPADETVESTDP